MGDVSLEPGHCRSQCIPGLVQLEHPGIREGVPVHSRGGTGWALRSFQPKPLHDSVIPTPSTESWAAPTHEGTAPVPQVPQGVTPQRPAQCFPFPVSANPGELFPTSPCLLLAPPWGLWGSPDFSGKGFGTSSGFSACLGEACSFKAALQEFSSTERDPDGMAQVSEGMSSLHSSI